MDQTTLEHPILGQVRWDPKLKRWEAEVELTPGYPIYFALSAEKAYQVFVQASDLFKAGVRYLDWARDAEPRCRQQVADDLLVCYNEGWAHAEPAEGPGPLSQEQFLQRLYLGAISLNPDGSAAWYYDTEDDLFAGHVIQVRVSEDRQFHDAHLAG